MVDTFLYSSISQESTLVNAINGAQTTLEVANLTTLLGGIDLNASAGTMCFVIEPDTANEEIVDFAFYVGNTVTVSRGRDGTTGKAHSAGSVVRHMAIGRDFRALDIHVNNAGSYSFPTGGNSLVIEAMHGIATGEGVVVGTDKVQTLTNKTLITPVIAGLTTEFGPSLTFEGATADAYETTLSVIDPTQDNTITLPNTSGTVVIADAVQTLTNKTMGDALNAGGFKITNLATPTAASDAVRKDFADAQVAAAATSAASAATSATSAATSASSAATSASSALTSANSASASATAAATSAASAATSASSAATSATSASNSEFTASEWAVKMSGPVAASDYSAKYNAGLAATSASSAATSATSAATSASSAATSASSAATSASSAATSAASAAAELGQAIPKSILDAKGDIVVATANDTPAKLTVATTNGYVLSANSATATGLEWISVAGGGGDITQVDVTSPITGGGLTGAVTIGIQAATTSQSGAVQLTDSVSSTSTTSAATPNSVKQAYDLAASAAAGLHFHDPVETATSTNITRSGLTAVNGYTPIAGDRILVRAQTAPAENGIFAAAAGAWTRTTDFDSWDEVYTSAVYVKQGNLSGESYITTVPSSGTVGTTPITWALFSSDAVYAAGTGLTLTGTTFAIDSTVTTNAGTSTLTNKTIALGSNTVSGTLAQFNTAVTDADLASLAGTETLTNKTIALGSNTVSGTLAQFNTAVTDADLASLAGAETLTNKTIALGSNTVSGTIAQFNTAVTDADLATLAGSETLTNKTVNLANNTLTGTLAQFNTAVSDADLASIAGTETLTNKTLTTPTINTPTLTLSGTSSTTLGRVSWDSTNQQFDVGDGTGLRTITADNAAATLTNKTISGSNNTISNISLTSQVTGTLPISAGGTNITTYATGDILYASAANTLSKLPVGTNTHVLTLTGGLPVWAAPTGGGPGGSPATPTTIGAVYAKDPSTAVTASMGVGYNVLVNNTGIQNVALGQLTLQGNTTGVSNMAVGSYSLQANTTGSDNVGMGHATLFSNQTGNKNIAVGTSTMQGNTGGSNNTAIGHNAMYFSTASNLTGIGFEALNNNSTGIQNTAIGYRALRTATTATSNTGIGHDALFSATTGSFNTAVGAFALDTLTTGASNVAIGEGVLHAVTTAIQNVAVGREAMAATGEQSLNVAVGYRALFNNTANSLTAVGWSALLGNTTGIENTAVGYAALTANTTGTKNTAAGFQALDSNTTASQNTAFGANALAGVATSGFNTAIGSGALTVTTGASNTAVGKDAGSAVSSGNNNTIIGEGAGTTLSTGSNNLILGSTALPSAGTISNEITLGSSAITKFRIPGLNIDYGYGFPYTTNAVAGAAYTLVLTDAGKLVERSHNAANTLTVPTNATVAFPVGTRIRVLQTGNGQTTIAGTAGVTVNGAPGLKLIGQWYEAELIKRATDTWVAVGRLAV